MEHLRLGHAPEHADILVGNAHALGIPESFQTSRVFPQLLFKGHNIGNLLQEEHVDLGGIIDNVQVGLLPDQLRNGKQPVIGAVADIAQELCLGAAVKLFAVQMAHAGFQRPDRLQQGFLHGPAHRHNFAGGLHLGIQGVVGIGELVKGEPGNLGHHIVKGGFKGRGGVGNADLVQAHAHGDFGGDPGDWVAGGLGGQGRGTGHPGVDLDEVILEG